MVQCAPRASLEQLCGEEMIGVFSKQLLELLRSFFRIAETMVDQCVQE
jgi:hypothetical protein